MALVFLEKIGSIRRNAGHVLFVGDISRVWSLVHGRFAAVHEGLLQCTECLEPYLSNSYYKGCTWAAEISIPFAFHFKGQVTPSYIQQKVFWGAGSISNSWFCHIYTSQSLVIPWVLRTMLFLKTVRVELGRLRGKEVDPRRKTKRTKQIIPPMAPSFQLKILIPQSPSVLGSLQLS